MAIPIRGFPFGPVTDRPVAAAPAAASTGVRAPAAGVDIATLTLAYQMMRDAKALPTTKKVLTAAGVELLVSNAQRTSPMFVRVRAALDNSVSTPYVYLGTDSSQTQGLAALDRIGNGGQIELTLYPGQELWGAYTGDAATKGDVFVSSASLDEAITLVKRTTGQ